MKYSPNTPISCIIDYQKLKKKSHNTLRDDPYRGVLERINDDYMRPLSILQDYIQNKVTHTCGARHERGDCEYGVPSCTIRRNNLACLHGIDFRRNNDGYIRFGLNNWATQIFTVAYVLKEAGYNVPLFITHPDLLLKLCDRYDKWDSNPNWPFGEGDLYSETNPKTMRFQKTMGNHFEARYVKPIKKSFEDFWKENVSISSS